MCDGESKRVNKTKGIIPELQGAKTCVGERIKGKQHQKCMREQSQDEGCEKEGWGERIKE